MHKDTQALAHGCRGVLGMEPHGFGLQSSPCLGGDRDSGEVTHVLLAQPARTPVPATLLAGPGGEGMAAPGRGCPKLLPVAWVAWGHLHPPRGAAALSRLHHRLHGAHGHPGSFPRRHRPPSPGTIRQPHLHRYRAALINQPGRFLDLVLGGAPWWHRVPPQGANCPRSPQQGLRGGMSRA